MEPYVIMIGLVGLVVVVASLLSGTVERIGVPIVVVFLALGAALGPLGLGIVNIGLHAPALETLAILALALVLFSDAVTIEIPELRAQRRLLWRVLGPGTLIPAAIIALTGWLLLDLSGPAAAILGAALASTDPVLLRSVLRSGALPPTARVALRLESGMNDAVLLPVVVLALLLLQPAGAVTTKEVTRSVVGLFLLGPALGALVGWVGIIVLVGVRGRLGVRRDYESLYALGLAFTAYAAAQAVGGSGFLAAFAAGLVVAAQDVELCDCFLEYGEASAEMLLLLTFVAFGTSLIWTGLLVADARTLLFAAVALVVRTAVLFPVLSRAGVEGRDRRLIALFGPRGLSSLLLVLLPVFAGAPGAERLFTIVCLVVLLSVVLHGGVIGAFLRATAAARREAAATEAERSSAAAAAPPAAPVALPERISIDELRALWARGEPVIVADARTERSYRVDDIKAHGAIRLPPEDAVRTATALRLSQHATLVLYCA